MRVLADGLVGLHLAVLPANVRLLLEDWADAVGYAFTDADWDAVEHGLSGLALRPWDYPLAGESPVTLALSLGASGCVVVEGDAPAERSEDLAALAALLACYRVDTVDLGLAGLIALEFGECARPAVGALMGCSREHLALCPECQEAQDRFRGASWQALAEISLPLGYAGASLLSDEGRRYFLPAYLLAAIRGRSTEALAELLAADVAGRDHWTVLQRRLVAFVAAQARECAGAE